MPVVYVVRSAFQEHQLDEEQRLHLTVKIVTDDTFARHEGFDLATFDDENWPQLNLPSFCVLKQERYNVFKSRVAARFQLPENKVRLWILASRQNKTVPVEVIRHNMTAKHKDLRLYLDVIPGPKQSSLLLSAPDRPPGHLMIFLKHFDASKQSLFGVRKVYVSRNSKVQDLHHIINERMRWAPGTALRLYESEIQDGDVICFQVEQAEEELDDLEKLGLYSNPVQFYGFLQRRVTIFFRPKLGRRDNDHPEFSLVLSKKDNYATGNMSQKAGEYLRHDPSKLRFTTTHAASGAAKEALKCTPGQRIADFMGLNNVNPTTTVILYEKLGAGIVEPEAMRSLKVIWIGIQTREEAFYPFSLPRTSRIRDLADQLAQIVTLTPGGTGKIRVFEVSKDGKMQEFMGSDTIGSIPDQVDLYAEVWAHTRTYNMFDLATSGNSKSVT
ncbi:ICP0-binding domain of ubiquitin-specific protease 7-domain-containing protein [Pisolithus albus]|nr:ICP0-binding domain of ubiquitin-specific protease 7-domain-containing protein [Pisolithus albus]